MCIQTQWPFDPEFWDWKTLKRNCLALMGEEAAIVSSIDTLNDTDEQEMESALGKLPEYKDLEDFLEAKKLREQGFVSARFRNWRAYMQYCVLCDKEFLGHRIVRHAQKHFKDGVYLCPICADSFESREVLEPHVASHVKQSCKERLAAMKAARKVTKPPQSPKKQPTSDPQISQDCYCPVTNCTKAFKFFRNLMAHVRSHKDDEEAMRFLEIQKQKVVCQYCRRQFVNVRHLNDHLQMHCGTRPYICIQLDCKANFNSNSELLMHRKTHPEFKAQCMFPNCGQVFSEAYLLYDHEAQHYLTYTCQTDNCGKIFYSQSEFLSHQEHHRPNDAVNSFVVINQNPAVSVMPDPPPESTLMKEDAHPAECGFERNNREAFMNDVSKANASSLMLDNGGHMHNGGHQYGLMHADSTGDHPDARKSGQLDNGNSLSTIDSLPDGSYHTPYAQSENSCLTQCSSVDVPMKCATPEAQVALKDCGEISKTETTSTAGYEQVDNSTDGVVSPHSTTHNIFPYDEECPDADLEKNKSKIQNKSDEKPIEKVPKPFKCDQDDCEFSFMTKEALFKHLSKMHDFSIEMIEELKRIPSKLSPYPCQICPKTFTRTTGLRIHYEKVHRLSKAEMQKLKISARNRRAFKLNKDGPLNSQPNSERNTNPQFQCERETEKTRRPSSSKSTPTKEERKDKLPKRLSLKLCETDNAFSPYRPYRCVHEGCTAAFTIQQNLILHYRAMHQASLPPLKAEPEAEKMFTCDKATAMMASMSLGTFNCDRPECALPFDSVEKYIEHIKNFHKEIAISERGSVDPTFRCEYDGCDRVYTTKSNLLRHLIKKHDYVYDPKATDGRRTKSIGLFPGINNGKENVENKIKVKKKNTKKKDGKAIEHWTSFGKPTLKSHEEASAMCTKKSALQYPCMIIGCDTVERAERSIFKHYATHGLTERYIEDQRSQFIFCKKYSRSRFKDTSKSEGASSSSETEPDEGEKLCEQMFGEQDPEEQNPEEKLTQDETKMFADNTVESQASNVTEGGAKRGRPRKPPHPTPACPQRMQTLRNRLTVTSSTENSNPGTPTPQEQRDDSTSPGPFKPLGLEDSFLTFLETSETTNASKRKLNEKGNVEVPPKRKQIHKQKAASRSKKTNELRNRSRVVDFRNPLNLKSVSNVKIVMDKTFSDGADSVLKQLQHMKPMVIIKRS
uniref:C2H2-type domain-containing protein n=1 Tax=Poecilia mexicana TaxID=48701 RepID=A0A3B3YPI8_9TELE